MARMPAVAMVMEVIVLLYNHSQGRYGVLYLQCGRDQMTGGTVPNEIDAKKKRRDAKSSSIWTSHGAMWTPYRTPETSLD